MIAIAVRYDLRIAPFAATTHADAYAACLEQVAWIEEHGAGDIVVLSEHHGVEDGFCPAPFTLAAAIASRTTRLPIMIAAVLVPVTDPVRTAEQAVLCDLISRGRVSFVAGIGYRDDEFAMAGVEKKKRAPLTEEYIEVMRKAWTGEPFEWQGRTIRVTPKPFTQPHPPLLIGGSVEASARRAARLNLPYMPAVNDETLKAAYEDEAAKVGYTGGFALMPNTTGMIFISEDPDKTWEQIGRYALYDAETYASWQEEGGRSAVKSSAEDLAALKAEGVYKVLTPAEAIDLAKANPGTTFTMHPLMAGIPAEIGWRSLELLRDEVIPAVRG